MGKPGSKPDHITIKMRLCGSCKILPVFLICFFLLTCGIEDYPYIYPIPTGNITQEMNSLASVVIPNSNLGNMYFTHFAIFYRIYISDFYESSPSEGNLTTINSVLNSDFNRVQPFIGNDSMGSSAIASLFSGMRYHTLELEDANINSVLSTQAFNRTLTIDFPQRPGSIPFLSLGTTQYNLLRSDWESTSEVLPDNRYFINSPELRNPSNISDAHINVDITDNPSAVAEKRHTYVSMYIVALGFDPQTYVQLYSTPVFVGVLRLPDA